MSAEYRIPKLRRQCGNCRARDGTQHRQCANRPHPADARILQPESGKGLFVGPLSQFLVKSALAIIQRRHEKRQTIRADLLDRPAGWLQLVEKCGSARSVEAVGGLVAERDNSRAEGFALIDGVARAQEMPQSQQLHHHTQIRKQEEKESLLDFTISRSGVRLSHAPPILPDRNRESIAFRASSIRYFERLCHRNRRTI